MKCLSRILAVLTLIFGGLNFCYACICTTEFKDIKSTQDLKLYDFVALVKVTDEKIHKEWTEQKPFSVAALNVEIIELFKGKPVSVILEYDIKSSCDMGIEKGQEWLVFAVRSGDDVTIRACGRNRKYKDKNGVRDWRWRAYKDLNDLRSVLNHSVVRYGDENDQRAEYYNNKQQEILERYVDGKLNGERKIWYPNGKLLCKQNYKMGTLHGKSEWFYPSGQIENEDYYIDGRNAHISRFYYDSVIVQSSKSRLIKDFFNTEDSLNFVFKRVQPRSERVYNSSGKEIIYRQYNRIGKILSEKLIDPETNISTDIEYGENGLILGISHSRDYKGIGSYIRYDQKGIPVSEGSYDDKSGEVKR